MGALRVLGLVVSALSGTVIALLIMVSIVDAKLSDLALMGIAGACAVVALFWGANGAKLPPKWLAILGFMPCVMLGICVMMGAKERYPLLWPGFAGAAATLLFVMLGLATSWRSINDPEATPKDGVGGGITEKFVATTFIFFLAGVFFVQPIPVLINGQGQSQPPLFVEGIVSNAYQTHGKGASNYLVLTGPAAAFHSTWSAGEFEVDYRTYEDSPVGSRKCVTIRTGILRLRWWTMDAC